MLKLKDVEGNTPNTEVKSFAERGSGRYLSMSTTSFPLKTKHGNNPPGDQDSELEASDDLPAV